MVLFECGNDVVEDELINACFVVADIDELSGVSVCIMEAVAIETVLAFVCEADRAALLDEENSLTLVGKIVSIDDMDD